MKMEEILKLIEAVSASELTDFKYEENGTKLNLKKEQQKVEIIQSPGVVPVTGTVTAGLQTAEILQNHLHCMVLRLYETAYLPEALLYQYCA